jgi:hypothetical protein
MILQNRYKSKMNNEMQAQKIVDIAREAYRREWEEEMAGWSFEFGKEVCFC